MTKVEDLVIGGSVLGTLVTVCVIALLTLPAIGG